MSPNNKKTQPKKKKGVAQRTPKQQSNPNPKNRGGTSSSPPSSAPYAQAQVFRQVEPKIKANYRGCTIEHREPIGLIGQTGSPFTIHINKPLNPGLYDTFKWLSAQAVCWEKYWFEYCYIEYFSRCPATNTGAVMLAIDHDAADPPPSSEDIMMTYYGSAEDAVWVRSLRVNLRCDKVQRFVRNSGLGANLDIKTYDVGTFFGATVGVGSSANAAGKCFINYKVHFVIPQLPAIPVSASGSFTGGGTMNSGNPLGDAPQTSALAAGVTIDQASNVTFRDIGSYLTSLTASGTGITNMNPPVLLDGQATVTDAYGSIPAGGTTGIVKSLVNIAQPNTIMHFLNTATTVTGSHLDIARGPGLS
jgi:hypothetical protein